MSFGVGITMMKMATMKSDNARSKHTGDLVGIAYEALEERRCKDPDYDPSRTHLNKYEGERSAAVLVRTMLYEADQYSKARKAAGGRVLRNTAAIGFATIVKPYNKFILSLPDNLKDKFFDDSNYILDKILGKDNIRARVRHLDEVADHEHTFRMGFAPSGKLETAYYFQPKVLGTINRTYPPEMRARGWDIADCDVFDPKLADSDPEYLKKRLEKRMNSGRPSWAYKRDKALEDAQKIIQDAQRQADNILFKARRDVQVVLSDVVAGNMSIQDALVVLDGMITNTRA